MSSIDNPASEIAYPGMFFENWRAFSPSGSMSVFFRQLDFVFSVIEFFHGCPPREIK